MEEQKTEEVKEEVIEPSKADIANAAAERLEKANMESTRIMEEAKLMAAEERLGGETEAGQIVQPKPKLTDQEYAEAMERGEVDPFKADGFGI